MDVNDWDLQAVVRSCCSSSTAASSPDPFSFFPNGDGRGGGEAMYNTLSDVSMDVSGSSSYDLEELCRRFIIRPPPPPTPRPLSLSTPVVLHRPQRKALRHPPEAPRSKKRKNQQKKVVCQVVVDGPSADPWAWRKYGQKPIKGSPYPRGYYRCSSSKGCPARKQVERSREDPGALTITYTAEHNHPVPTHRSSLAGSTRHKPPQPASTCHQSPPDNLSPMTPLTVSTDVASEEDDDGAGETLTVEDMVGDDGDLLFMDLGGPQTAGGGDLFASPWLYQAAAAAAAGGGG